MQMDDVEVVSRTRGDGSQVHDVLYRIDNEQRVRIRFVCIDEAHAKDLAISLAGAVVGAYVD